MLGVFLGSPTGAPVKIATRADLDPLISAPDNIYIIGVDDVGNVAFLCESYGNPSGYSLVVGSPTGVLSVIQSGSSAPGTAGSFFLSSNRANYSMNASGDVAFFASVFNDPTIFVSSRRRPQAVSKLASSVIYASSLGNLRLLHLPRIQ
jgi:hypothetical protein